MMVKLSKNSIFLLLHFVSIVFYIFVDYFKSFNAGVVEADRTAVYIIIVINVVIQLTYSFSSIIKGKFPPLICILFLLSLWEFFASLLTDTLNWGFLVHFGLNTWWISTSLFTYYLTSDDVKNVSKLSSNYSFFFLIYVFLCIISRNRLNSSLGRENSVINYAYYFIVCTPFVILLKNKKLKYLLLIVSLVVTVFSYKRGAMIVLPLMLFGGVLTEERLSKKILQSLKYLFCIFVVFLIFFLVFDKRSNGFLRDRFAKISLYQGSGRREMFEMVIDSIKTRDIFHLIVGLGSSSSIKLLGTGIHNDYLEILSSYGIIGLLIYVLVLIYYFQICSILKKRQSKMAVPAIMSFIYVITVGLYGSSFFSHSFFAVSAMIGILHSALLDKGEI